MKEGCRLTPSLNWVWLCRAKRLYSALTGRTEELGLDNILEFYIESSGAVPTGQGLSLCLLPPLPTVSVACICVVHACVCITVRVRALNVSRALKQGLSLNRKLTIFSRLTGPWAAGIYLRPQPNVWVAGRRSHAQLFMWALGILTQLLMLSQQVLLGTEPSPQPLSLHSQALFFPSCLIPSNHEEDFIGRTWEYFTWTET